MNFSSHNESECSHILNNIFCDFTFQDLPSTVPSLEKNFKLFRNQAPQTHNWQSQRCEVYRASKLKISQIYSNNLSTIPVDKNCFGQD